MYRQQIVGPRCIENEYLLVEFDARTGRIVKLVDKKTGANLVDPAAPIAGLEFLIEAPRRMSSWIIGEAQPRVGSIEILSVEDSQKGPHLATAIVKAKINDSTVTVTYSLKAGEPWVEMAIQTFWLERGGPEIGTPSLRVQFPLALDEAKARYEIPFGSLERNLNHGEEVPSLRWADVTGKIRNSNTAAGFTLLNDSQYGHSLEDSTLRMTLIRSSLRPGPAPGNGRTPPFGWPWFRTAKSYPSRIWSAWAPHLTIR